MKHLTFSEVIEHLNETIDIWNKNNLDDEPDIDIKRISGEVFNEIKLVMNRQGLDFGFDIETAKINGTNRAFITALTIYKKGG